MTLFLVMLLLHLFYDFNQGEFVSKWKYENHFIMFIHALTWGLFVSLPVMMLYSDTSQYYISLVWLTFTHFLIDTWKCQYPNDPKYFWTVYVDQFTHILTIVAIIFLF
jgi:hypothetical protein